jgi:hypothetical protein
VNALLHDLPEFAPAGVDAKTLLAGRYGEKTAYVVPALQARDDGRGHRERAAPLTYSSGNRATFFGCKRCLPS